jgi:hypothetical protein
MTSAEKFFFRFGGLALAIHQISAAKENRPAERTLFIFFS